LAGLQGRPDAFYEAAAITALVFEIGSRVYYEEAGVRR
jgi:hypothetical protein